MNRKKSIVLLVVMAIVLAVLTFMTFASFPIPGYKNGTMRYNSFLGTIDLDSDLDDGVCYELTLRYEISSEDEEIDEKEVIKTLKNRLQSLGYHSSVVTAFKAEGNDDYSYRVEMKATDTASTDIAVVASYGELEFSDGDGAFIMDADGVSSAKYRATTTSGETSHFVELKFTDEGLATLRSAMSNSTSDSGFTLRISLGETELFSNTLEESYITNNSIYITSSTAETARQLALQISSGGLAYEYEISDQMTVSSSLGVNAKSYVVWGTAAAVLVIFIALILIFGGLGLIADLTIFSFLLVEILMMILVPGITLNFAGVIGILTAIALTVNNMAIIMVRVREEYRNGKTIKAAVKTSFGRSLATVLETNIILGAIALAIFFICPGYVQCFAITFGIGVVVSTLATLFLSRLLAYMALPLFGEKSEGFLKLKREAE